MSEHGDDYRSTQVDWSRDLLGETRAAVERLEEQLKSARDSCAEREAFFSLRLPWTGTSQQDHVNKEKLAETRSDLKHLKKQLKSVTKSLAEVEVLHQLKHKVADAAEMEISCTRKLQDIRSDLKRHQERLESVKHSFADMSLFYKKKLHESRRALKEKEDELRSFKDRLAGELTLSIQTGSTESMNSPVSKTRLKEKYDDLRLVSWPKLRVRLEPSNDLEDVRHFLQKLFKDAAEQMQRKKESIEEVFKLNREAPPQKVEEFRKSTIQNLQLALFHSRKEDVLKTVLPGYTKNPPDVQPFISECAWLACLMALNNPPLQPDWENHVPGSDRWDILPRELRSASDRGRDSQQPCRGWFSS